MKNNLISKRFVNYLCCSMIFLTLNVFAQVPTNSNTFEGIQKGINTHGASIDYLQGKKYKTTRVKGSKKIFIKDFVLIDNSKLNKKEIDAILAPYRNQNLNFQEIVSITEKITKAYHDKGYVLAKAYLEKGAYKNKILSIKIMEGKLETVTLKNTSLVNSSNILSFLDNLKGRVIKLDDLERKLLLINDEAGLNIKSVSIVAGKENDTSDLLLNTVATNRVNGYMLSDNYGSKNSGEYRFSIGGSVNSIFGDGDKLSLSGLVTNGSKLKNGYISYSSYIGSSGLRATGSYYETQYSLGGIYSALDAFGDSKFMELSFKYPLIKHGLETLEFSITPQYQKISNTMLGQTVDKRSKNLLMDMNYFKNFFLYDIESSLTTNILYTTGKISFLDKSLVTPIEGNFNKLDIDLSLSNQIYDNVILTNSLKTQIALGNKILDPSQQITIGGAYGVRAYYNTQESGDSGYIYTIDLGYNIVQHNYKHQLDVFYDIGRAYSANSELSKIYSKTLQDIGVGYSIYYKQLFVKLQLATKVDSKKSYVFSNIGNSTMLLGQIGWSW